MSGRLHFCDDPDWYDAEQHDPDERADTLAELVCAAAAIVLWFVVLVVILPVLR